MEMFKFISKSNLNTLPQTAGVYCFTEKNKIVYIGKAINIKNRVKDHFNRKTPWEKALLHQNFNEKIGFLKTDSEIEALILEANLIKKYQPKFNVMWRDDKNYFYACICYPKGKLNLNNVPYVFITHQPKQILNLKFKISNSIYVGPFVEGTTLKKTLRFLRKSLPYYTTKNHSKNKCTYCHLELCPGPNPDYSLYKKNLKYLILILKGKKNIVLKNLKKEMENFSKYKEFEKAGKIRDKIYSLQQIMSHSNIINNKKIIDETNTSKILNKILKINKIDKIECYDVSNIQGNFATGSMVSAQYKLNSGWSFDNNQFRKFRIKIENKPNDIAMLKEVLQRRFSHPEWKYPEVILIDGGIAQLNIAIKTKNKKKETKSIRVVSIAKSNKELFIEGTKKPILLKNLSQEIYNLILRLDEEAHRFAITYHRNLRKKYLLQ